MEIEEEIARYTKQGEVEMEPPLLHIISSNQVDGFDTIQENQQMIDFDQHTPSSSSHLTSLNVQEVETMVKNGWHNGTDTNAYDRTHQASMSMPVTPLRHSDPATPKKVLFNEQNQVISDAKLADVPPISGNVKKTKPKFYSQPMPASVPRAKATETTNNPPNLQQQDQAQRSGDRPRDHRFDNFKTWSGKLEKLATFRVKPVEQPNPEQRLAINTEGNLPVDRYFDALQGPDLDRVRPSEELMLPDDKSWPFLLRFPVASFGICLGVSSQAILWKTIATSISKKYIHLSEILNMILWFVSIALMAVVTLLYALKLIFYFEAVRREYYHPIRVNFFFAPFITLLFLALGVPPSITKTLPQVLWYILMIPFLCLELKIYGQWMSGGQRRLSKVANPSNHLSVVGNFVGSLLGASMGLKEGPLFFFAVGLAHYTVLFVTLYQRLPTNETLPKELHPVFFLFVAAPSVASMAWARIQGSFDNGAKIAYFIAIFLYFSLAVRISFFRGIRFSLTWWAYTFPMTGAAIATIRYANAVTNWATRSLAVALCIVSMLTVTALLITTLLQAFVFRKLFPNDFAIAISDRPPRSSHSHHRKWFHHFRHGSSDTKEIEHYLKFVHPADSKDLESSVEAPSSHSQ